jgi:hypothetical protein
MIGERPHTQVHRDVDPSPSTFYTRSNERQARTETARSRLPESLTYAYSLGRNLANATTFAACLAPPLRHHARESTGFGIRESKRNRPFRTRKPRSYRLSAAECRKANWRPRLRGTTFDKEHRRPDRMG